MLPLTPSRGYLKPEAVPAGNGLLTPSCGSCPDQEAEQVALFSRAPAFFKDGVDVYVFVRPCEKNVDI